MIVLLGACGLERLAEPLRRHTGAEVTVSAWNDLALLARLPTPPALVYVDLLEWSAAMPFVSAHLRGLQPPPPDPARTAVVAALQATGLPVVYRGSREPLAAGLAAALLAGARVLDVRALWAQHGILSDGVRHGPGHGEAELGPLGTSRRTGQTAAEVEADALYALWYGRVHGARKCVAVWAAGRRRLRPPQPRLGPRGPQPCRGCLVAGPEGNPHGAAGAPAAGNPAGPGDPQRSGAGGGPPAAAARR